MAATAVNVRKCKFERPLHEPEYRRSLLSFAPRARAPWVLTQGREELAPGPSARLAELRWACATWTRIVGGLVVAGTQSTSPSIHLYNPREMFVEKPGMAGLRGRNDNVMLGSASRESSHFLSEF